MLCTALIAATACGGEPGAADSENAVIDPPTQCSPERPDCSISQDFPDGSDLNAGNSAGLRYSAETNALVIDRASSLPDNDDDGVPDDADGCPGMPDWITCDNDPSNDGLYQTVFYDPSGAAELVRTSIATTTADIPQIDIYFLVDATPTLDAEIRVLKDEILNIIDDIRLTFPEAQFGLGLYREYPLSPLAAPYSQSPYHHILDLTDDRALVAKAVSTLCDDNNPMGCNIVANATAESAATQALYSIASGRGLGDMVPNRGACPSPGGIGYPCFRPGALHVVMNITDAAVINGPNTTDPQYVQYVDPPFALGVGMGVMDLPPVEMFPALFDADSAAMPLDLGDLSGQSLTLMGMSTLLTNRVNTAAALGCDTQSGIPPGDDMDGKDAIIAFRFDSMVPSATVFADNTHWPGANVALFDEATLDPLTALDCDGGAAPRSWGSVTWAPVTAQQYYIAVDGIIPASEPGHTPEGAFALSILHDGDPAPNPAWLTHNAPVVWDEVETELLASNIRVASVVTPVDAVTIPSDARDDAWLIADDTGATTKLGIPRWVGEVASPDGEELDFAIINTINLAKTDSVYTISMVDVDNDATPGFDERDFVALIRQHDCAQGEPLECSAGSGNSCSECDVGAFLEYEVVFTTTAVSPTGVSQVFDFELVARADDAVEVERIPVRVMVPDSAAHEFDDLPGSSFYRNVYDSTARCITPPERPKWGDLTWTGTTPGDSTIEFQIRTANTAEELQSAIPAVVVIPTDTDSDTLNLTEELIADGQLYGLPYIQITAVLNASTSPPATPTLGGWTFEFVCEAAE
jgi:hypothetical protein